MSDRRPIVVLGASGFIGRPLARRLARGGAAVRAVTRQPMIFDPGIEARTGGGLSAATDWPALFAGARAVIHLASRAHAPATGDSWIAQEATTAAAIGTAAAREGVERTILLSSIKVLGERTEAWPFSDASRPAPLEPYGWAKLAIEDAMRGTAPGLVILRAPLVYGPQMKGNLRTLLRLIDRGVPLPFAAIRNRRSLIALDNLLDLIERATEHPAAPGRVLLMRDVELSTSELAHAIAGHLGRRPRLFPMPPALLRLGAATFGQREAAGRLLDSLVVDDGATRRALGWQPRIGFNAAMAAACAGFHGG